MNGPLTTTRISRRRLLQAGATLAAATAVGISWVAPAHAVPVVAPSVPAAPTARVMTVPTRYGTPTDLARTSQKTAWTRDHTGTVLQYDKAAQIWRPAAGHDWTAVLTYGSVVLARWGRPSGGNALVMVFGTAPKTHPKPPPRRPVPTPPRAPVPQLAATGLNTGALTTPGLAAIALGALLAARNRRGGGYPPNRGSYPRAVGESQD